MTSTQKRKLQTIAGFVCDLFHKLPCSIGFFLIGCASGTLSGIATDG
jgi:hypothetical protein